MPLSDTGFVPTFEKNHPNIIIFDGDALRQAFGNDLGYSKEYRLACAMRYSRLCKFLLTEQGILVVCCTISMFDEVRNWNRENISDYTEIYAEVPMTILEMRNQKNLYRDVKAGATENVVGMDLNPKLPKTPYIRLVNDGTRSPEEMCGELMGKITVLMGEIWHGTFL